MKKSKRFTKSAVLAATMAMGFVPVVTQTMSVFAAEGDTVTISIENATEGNYKAFLMFSGDYAADGDNRKQEIHREILPETPNCRGV